MNSLTYRSPMVGEIDADRLWFVANPHLRTKVAIRETLDLVEWVKGGTDDTRSPTDQELFIALHTCAYRAVRHPRSKRITTKERSTWIDRWQMIRGHIVEANLGLAYSMMSRFSSRKIDEDDLLSDAMMGLTRAVDRFNPWKGYRFSTYACNVIVRALMRRGKRERHRRRLFPVQFDTSFEKPAGLPDHQRELYVERLNRALNDNSGDLSELETRILANRFPVESEERLTFQEIGEAVGLSKERVRQIQNIAIRKLRRALVSDPVLH